MLTLELLGLEFTLAPAFLQAHGNNAGGVQLVPPTQGRGICFLHKKGYLFLHLCV